jgi:hypothetical protein
MNRKICAPDGNRTTIDEAEVLTTVTMKRIYILGYGAK